MDYYTIICNFNTGKEFFGISKSATIENKVEAKMVTAIPVQTLGTFFMEILNAGVSRKSAIVLLSNFMTHGDASEYVKYEITTYRNVISRIKKYIDFFEEKNIQYDDKFFSFLVNGDYFLLDQYTCSVEDEARDKPLWDEESGVLIDDISKIYSYFVESNPDHSSTYHFYGDYLANIALISLEEVIKSGKRIKKCKNCDKYFLPANRSDELYCDNPSPQDEKLTCKQYGARRLWYEKQRKDELASLAKNIASAKCMLAKRNPDIPGYAASYNYFKGQRLAWIKAVKEGTKTREEYREWLLYMQSQKIIKEAIHGSH